MCSHTGTSEYGLNLSSIFMFSTIYGVEKSQCDCSTLPIHRKKKQDCGQIDEHCWSNNVG